MALQDALWGTQRETKTRKREGLSKRPAPIPLLLRPDSIPWQRLHELRLCPEDIFWLKSGCPGIQSHPRPTKRPASSPLNTCMEKRMPWKKLPKTRARTTPTLCTWGNLSFCRTFWNLLRSPRSVLTCLFLQTSPPSNVPASHSAL